MAAATPVDSKMVVSQAEAQTIRGAVDGFCAAAVAAEGEFDLSPHRGEYVKISAANQAFWVCFFNATGQAIVLTSQATQTKGVPELMPANSKDHIVVPKNYPFMRYKPLAGTDGILTVVRG